MLLPFALHEERPENSNLYAELLLEQPSCYGLVAIIVMHQKEQLKLKMLYSFVRKSDC